MVIKAQTKPVKAHFDQTIYPRTFSKGDLTLLYDQDNDKLGTVKFKTMWHGPYIIKCVLQKGAYEVVDYDGNALSQT